MHNSIEKKIHKVHTKKNKLIKSSIFAVFREVDFTLLEVIAIMGRGGSNEWGHVPFFFLAIFGLTEDLNFACVFEYRSKSYNAFVWLW